MAVKADSVYALQRSFRKHLSSLGHSIAEANIISNASLLLFNQSLKIGFDDFLSNGFTKELRDCVLEYFMLSGNKTYAEKEVEQYFSAMQLLYTFYTTEYEQKLELDDTSPAEGYLLGYCESMRIQYSYKPLLLMALLDTASVNGSASLSEIVHYFISFYTERARRGFRPEKEDSIFSKGEISFPEAKQNILNNAVKVLVKDGIVCVEDEIVSFTSLALYDYLHNKTKVALVCSKLIESYYQKLSEISPSGTQLEDEKVLGQVLNKMYHSAISKEKVIMIHLFGIKYGAMIENEGLSVRDIIRFANLPVSYYAEVRKGIRLSKYVVAKD